MSGAGSAKQGQIANHDATGANLLDILNWLLTRYDNPMRFLYLLSPAAWLKIAIGSLLLGGVALWFLAGYRINITRVAPEPKAPPLAESQSASIFASAGAENRPGIASAPPAHIVMPAPPNTAQNQAIAPEGILDQYAEFAEVLEFDDTALKPDFVLPDAVAPPALLDPNWNGNAP